MKQSRTTPKVKENNSTTEKENEQVVGAGRAYGCRQGESGATSICIHVINLHPAPELFVVFYQALHQWRADFPRQFYFRFEPLRTIFMLDSGEAERISPNLWPLLGLPSSVRKIGRFGFVPGDEFL
ncbi:hypothetical protein AG1IA_09495 [Rhizoctonia solani AG-1 IA]|uniref:Uncharacterized protein n=1 Tax=Thanatephorus cucumeris (strain AG1-IA) TaxID=983506 RepID=L8WI48_THACA|nr:hypothetical protein AG1IA_09495 [Rhizoctonia solani AG-1 IA]